MTTLPLHGANVAHRLGLSESVPVSSFFVSIFEETDCPFCLDFFSIRIYEPPVDYVEKTFERTKNAALDYLKAVAGKFAPGVEVHIRSAQFLLG